MERTSGVLLHISSLPNDYGIGSFGSEARDFVDFLADTKQTYWQILPLTTTSYGDSPYQSFSAFAGNTHFIDFDALIEEGYITSDDVVELKEHNQLDRVDYAYLYQARRPVLEKAVQSFIDRGHHKAETFEIFLTNNDFWLTPFVQYMTIKENFDMVSWTEWPDEYRYYDKGRVDDFVGKNWEKAQYHYVTQFLFYKQWHGLKAYANEAQIQIIGDLPIYVAADSVEMWYTPELFLVDQEGLPREVAGVPPDALSDEGQYWGNPIYDWDYMERTGYQWWIDRMEANFDLYDVIRIDHFRGFESYWSVPFGAPSAADGQWVKGPGIKLFNRLKEALGEMPIIAEDLGYMTQDVIDMREATGYPGMKILQFGFNGYEDSRDLPHHYDANSVVYVGTHDNETAMGWYEDTASDRSQKQMQVYLASQPGESPAQTMNRGIAASAANTAIYTMQDLLELGNEARMNRPSTIGGNWEWRMRPNAITSHLKEELVLLSKTYFRVNGRIEEAGSKKDRTRQYTKRFGRKSFRP